MRKKEVEFNFSCNESDVRFMKELARKVFSIPRMAAMVAISGLTTIMLLGSIESSIATYPILIFASIITLGFIYFFLYTIITRPSLLKNIEESEGSIYDLTIHGSNMELSINGTAPIPLGIESIRNQFWQDTRYCLHIDCKALRTFICIPVNETTFDNLYGLANGLEKRKKRLIVIKKKGEKQ